MEEDRMADQHIVLESFVTITDNLGITHNVNLSNVTDITYLKDGSFGEIHFTNDRQILFVPSQHPSLSSHMAQLGRRCFCYMYFVSYIFSKDHTISNNKLVSDLPAA